MESSHRPIFARETSCHPLLLTGLLLAVGIAPYTYWYLVDGGFTPWSWFFLYQNATIHIVLITTAAGFLLAVGAVRTTYKFLPAAADNIECKLRIVAINDVYKLENFSKLANLIKHQSVGFDKSNVVTTLAGDFLAPSLLSSIDHGRGMVAVMNALPINMVCFGNHESDIPFESLSQRIHEFNGVWLNSNMEMELESNKHCPTFHVKKLRASDGTEQAVAFLGFLIGGGKHANTYRANAFGGHADNIEPVLQSAPKVVAQVQALHPELLPHGTIPLTHQDEKEDVELAKTGMFPVIIGGHDHEIIHHNVSIDETARSSSATCPVVKAGMNAEAAYVVDVVWHKLASTNKYGMPTVHAKLLSVNDYEKCPVLENLVQKTLAPIRALEAATMYELDVANGENYSSVGMRFHPTSMGTFLATAMRKSPRLQCDAVLLNSGAVRGNTVYGGENAKKKCVISFADLQCECPFDSEMLVVRMPGQVVIDAVALSRKKWAVGAAATAEEAPEAFQTDDGMQVVEDCVTQIAGERINPKKMYAVGCDSYDMKNNHVLATFAMQHPDHVPSVGGSGALEILVEYFCAQQWRKILKYYSNSELERHTNSNSNSNSNSEHVNFLDLEIFFHQFDGDKSGSIGKDDLERALLMSREKNKKKRRLSVGLKDGDTYEEEDGKTVPSILVVKQMIRVFDTIGHGVVSKQSIKKGLMKAGVYKQGQTPAPKRNLLRRKSTSTKGNIA